MHITYAQYASLCVSIDINLESSQVGFPPPRGDYVYKMTTTMHVISVAISLRCNCATVNWVDFWIARKWRGGNATSRTAGTISDRKRWKTIGAPTRLVILVFVETSICTVFARRGAHKQSQPFRKCRARSEIYIQPVAYVWRYGPKVCARGPCDIHTACSARSAVVYRLFRQPYRFYHRARAIGGGGVWSVGG